jgi:hypothetical protein
LNKEFFESIDQEIRSNELLIQAKKFSKVMIDHDIRNNLTTLNCIQRVDAKSSIRSHDNYVQQKKAEVIKFLDTLKAFNTTICPTSPEYNQVKKQITDIEVTITILKQYNAHDAYLNYLYDQKINLFGCSDKQTSQSAIATTSTAAKETKKQRDNCTSSISGQDKNNIPAENNIDKDTTPSNDIASIMHKAWDRDDQYYGLAGLNKRYTPIDVQTCHAQSVLQAITQDMLAIEGSLAEQEVIPPVAFFRPDPLLPNIIQTIEEKMAHIPDTDPCKNNKDGWPAIVEKLRSIASLQSQLEQIVHSQKIVTKPSSQKTINDDIPEKVEVDEQAVQNINTRLQKLNQSVGLLQVSIMFKQRILLPKLPVPGIFYIPTQVTTWPLNHEKQSIIESKKYIKQSINGITYDAYKLPESTRNNILKEIGNTKGNLKKFTKPHIKMLEVAQRISNQHNDFVILNENENPLETGFDDALNGKLYDNDKNNFTALLGTFKNKVRIAKGNIKAIDNEFQTYKSPQYTYISDSIDALEYEVMLFEERINIYNKWSSYLPKHIIDDATDPKYLS